MRDFVLFGIDLQNAFGKEDNPLCVPGAPEDMERVGNLIDAYSDNIKDIVLTLDTHEVDHVGHPGWWALADGSEPAPFTPVTLDMVETGAIRARDPENQEHAIDYVTTLGTVMIWPVHCVPGTESYELDREVERSVEHWEMWQHTKATYVKKGFQKNVEAFGVFEAEYFDCSMGSDFNYHLLANLIYKKLPIVVVGEALSHCVKRSVEQLVDALGLQPSINAEIILVRDCMSSVPGFEEVGRNFLHDMQKRGVVVCTLAELPTVLA